MNRRLVKIGLLLALFGVLTAKHLHAQQSQQQQLPSSGTYAAKEIGDKAAIIMDLLGMVAARDAEIARLKSELETARKIAEPKK